MIRIFIKCPVLMIHSSWLKSMHLSKRNKQYFRRYFPLLVLYAASILFQGCIWDSWDDFYDSMNSWQKKQIEKRYGSAYVNKDQIPEWQKEIKKYEKIMDEKIQASSNLGKIHRKLGESFAEIGSYKKCIFHLKKTIQLGIHEADVLYKLGLCQGNWAQKNNWKYTLMKQAEESFLSLLNIDPDYEKAKFQLGLVYFYGFGKNNPYRVLNDYITVTQKQYRKKAIGLLLRYKNKNPDDYKVYFALTNIYKIIGKLSLARVQMQDFISMLQKSYPDRYKDIKEYKSAIQNLSLLGHLQ